MPPKSRAAPSKRAAEDQEIASDTENGPRRKKPKPTAADIKLSNIANDHEGMYSRETEEERRQRLGKQYLRMSQKVLKKAQSEERSDSEDDDAASEGGKDAASDDGHARTKSTGVRKISSLDAEVADDIFFADAQDRTAQKLKQQILDRKGTTTYLYSQSVSAVGASDLTYLRGHHRSATCVALRSDDQGAFSGAKDGSLIAWDLSSSSKLRVCVANAGPITCVATSRHAPHVVCSGHMDGIIRVWDMRQYSVAAQLKGHRGPISGLAFRNDDSGQLDLYSASWDKTVKVWSVTDRTYMETLFGHGAELTAIDALGTERCVTVSRDRTCRVWKIADEAQLLFVPPAATTGSIDCVRWCSDTRFVSGGQDGFVQLWSTSKRKPLSNVQAHEAWVSSVAAMPGSDVVISGSCGQVGIHSLVGDDLQHVKNVAVRGWVNAASMTRDGRIAVLALGQEHRLGRWFVSKEGRSGIAIMPLVKSDVE